MKIRLAILMFVLSLASVSCNKKKHYQEDFKDLETPVHKTYTIGKGTYVKNKIPFIKIDTSKGEYFKLLEHGGELHAIVCDNGDLENFEYSDGYDANDYDKPDYYDKIIKKTNIQLYILEGEEWKPSTKWTVDCWGITEFCHDSIGNLYAYYYDTVGNESMNGSTLYRLNQDGSVDTTLLEDKDIISANPNTKGEHVDENGKKWETFSGGISVGSIYVTENDDVALTYVIPDIPPKLIFYDVFTGKKTFETEYFGSDIYKYVIHNEDLICFYSDSSKSPPTIITSNIKTGKHVRKSYFGKWDDWDPLNLLRLKICLGKEEDIYICTPNGIYGGKLNQETLDLLMPASQLGYEGSEAVVFFSVGWEGDFYLLYGPNDDNMDLYHFTLEEN